MIRFPFFKEAWDPLPPPEMEGNARLLEVNNQFIFTRNQKESTQKLTLDLSRKTIIY